MALYKIDKTTGDASLVSGGVNDGILVKKAGDTMTGQLTMQSTTESQIVCTRPNTTTSSNPVGISIGNSTPDGTKGSNYGKLRIWGTGAYRTDLVAPDSTANRTIKLPDSTSTLATTDDIATKVSKSGDTMTGELQVNRNGEVGVRVARANSGTSTVKSTICAGNNIPDGTTGATFGSLTLYGDQNRYAELQARNVTANREFQLPNKSGTIALTNDLNTKSFSFFRGRSEMGLTPWTAGSNVELDLNPTCERVYANLNDAPIGNTAIFEEYDSSSPNLPTANWYYVLTMQGDDTNYANQLAMGMQESQVYHRRKSGGSWYSWKPLIPKLSGITKQISISALAAGGEVFDQDYSWDDTYTILGIVGYQLEGNNYTRCCLNRMSFRNGASKHIFYSIKNTSATDATGALTLTVQLLTMS